MAYRILTAKTVITGDELKPENGYGILIHDSAIGEIAPIEALKKKCPNVPISDYGEAGNHCFGCKYSPSFRA